ncbi:class IV adenylate cyclase [Natronococcus sp. A-GB1]|uniref:class IV adenylate cyclase n=1 Tax=Natronococcus sp. A-GB1 TaxID=3037648 RepID=UPI00241FC557|nr:class IV adenylate cyclase [Natronococcus sp. A-GB1]MDG5759509.1 class IV adenylate cyclase [Natronococcus sp. A-GB1]
MYEVEVKVPADLEAVRARLDGLEATATGAVVQADTYYDAPHRSFPETDEALRIRTERLEDDPDETRLTYKGPLVDDASKSREEVETAVGDGEKVDAVLTKLGFEPAATVRKERERFELEGYTITLDSVDDVGEYVEVETEVDDESELENAREGAFDVLERLGLDSDDQLRTSYLELLLESG